MNDITSKSQSQSWKTWLCWPELKTLRLTLRKNLIRFLHLLPRVQLFSVFNCISFTAGWGWGWGWRVDDLSWPLVRQAETNKSVPHYTRVLQLGCKPEYTHTPADSWPHHLTIWPSVLSTGRTSVPRQTRRFVEILNLYVKTQNNEKPRTCSPGDCVHWKTYIDSRKQEEPRERQNPRQQKVENSSSCLLHFPNSQQSVLVFLTKMQSKQTNKQTAV